MVGNFALGYRKREIRGNMQIGEGLHHHSQKKGINEGINDKCQSYIFDPVLRIMIFQ